MKIKYIPLITLLCSISFAIAQTTEGQGWQWQYPKPQGNTLKDIYVFDANTAIAVGDLGTVIKTTDGGGSWAVQHHAGGTDIDLNSVHFIDENNGWAAGGIPYSNKNVLLKTSNGGKNWNEVVTGNTLPLNAVYFVDVDTGFAFGEDGIILRTTDGGNSWDIRSIDNYIGYYLDVFRFLAVTFTDKNTGFLVGSGYYGNEIYKTTDCGRTWQWNEQIIIPKIFGSLYDISFIDKNNGFITGDAAVFLKTTDGGDSWQQDTVGYYNHSVCFTDSLNGFVVGIGSYYPFIYSTSDGGNNWNEVSSDLIPGNALYKVRFSDKENGWILGGKGIIRRTTNGGKNWLAINQKPYQFNSIYFTDENTGWVVGDSGIILNTTNGGDDWDKQYQNDSLVFNSLQAIDDNNVIVVGNVNDRLPLEIRKAIIVLTTNGGLTWERQLFDTLYVFNSIFFINDSIGWITGSELLKTTDKGNTWNKITTDTNKPRKDIQFINENIGWGTLNAGNYILKTIDGGKNWNQKLVDSSISISSFHFVNENIGWAAGGSNVKDKTIFHTTNGGNSWILSESTPSSFKLYYSATNFVDENIGWVAGSKQYGSRWESIIIKTTDAGNTWFEQNAPNTVGISNIFPINVDVCYAAGYDGIFKTTDGGGVVSVESDREFRNNIPEQIELHQNYPNPFNPNTIIEYKLNKLQHVRLQIFNILGQEIEELVDEYEKAGFYKISWYPKNIASGIYFYRLTTTTGVISRKMLLIK